MDSDGRIIVDWIRDALPQQVVEVLSQDKPQEEPKLEAYEYTEENEIDNIIDAVFDEEGASLMSNDDRLKMDLTVQ